MNQKTSHGILSVLRVLVHLIWMGGLLLVQLNYRDAKPIYEQIKEGLRRLVVSGALAAGEKLPSVREMASQLAINPNTIQRAYRELESEGYIYTVSGKGTFVAENKNILEDRQRELLTEFDELVRELVYLEVSKESLCDRIKNIAEGGEKA